jgi:hypothetical protein
MIHEWDQRKLRSEIVEATAFIRSKLQSYDCDSRFTLCIKIEGSPDKRDATLTFDFDLSRNYGNHVVSPVLANAVNEMMHRMGFDKRNQAELLTYDPAEAATLAELQTPVPAPPGEPQI